MQLSKLNEKYPNKRAIITGANSGVGLEMIAVLLRNDWNVLGIDLNIDKLKVLAVSFKKLSSEQVDITNTIEFERVVSTFIQRYNGVDVMINNAGVGEGVRFKDYSLANWDWIIDINLKSVIAGCYFVYGAMQKQSSGVIVNMASAAGYANLPNMSPYNVTKAGVISLSESLAHEFAPFGVHVMCVTPTFFQSNILSQSKGTDDVLLSANRVVNNAKLDSEGAAKLILKHLHSNKLYLRFPFFATVIFTMKQFFPGLYLWLLRRYLVK